MKKILLAATISMLLFSAPAFGQKKVVDENYRRSSLCIIFIDEANMPNRELIKSVILESSVPDKYNDHNPESLSRVFDADRYTITSEDKELYKAAKQAAIDEQTPEGEKPKKAKMGGGAAGLKGFVGGVIKEATGQSSTTIVDDANLTDYGVKSLKFLNEKNVAKLLYDKWFIDNEGNFTDQVMIQRGQYGASMADVRMAANSIYGTRLLNSAGEELINNTFVVVSRFRYVNKDDVAKEISAASSENNDTSNTALAKLAMGEGYYVRVTSFLFKIDWNDEVKNTIYDMWDDIDRYDTADLYKLNFVGQETAFANVKQSVFSKSRPEEELIRIATINAQDAVLAKLEKKYDVFKTKTPILSIEPNVYAEIGLKEGIEEGDRYEVLEKTINEETGVVTYSRKGVVKVAKGGIWDNRYEADVLTGQAVDESLPQATLFETVSGGGFYPGMLIRQIK